MGRIFEIGLILGLSRQWGGMKFRYFLDFRASEAMGWDEFAIFCLIFDIFSAISFS